MGEPSDGWQTVLPTSHSAMQRLPYAQLEECERQILRAWENSRHHWSGIGKHTPLDDFAEAKKVHERLKLAADTPLGSGSFGVVQKVRLQSDNRWICLARKQVRPPYRRYPIHLLRDEANVMEKLDHDHIVKLVGTYCIQPNLYILLWPVAVCNLESLFNDIDCLRTGHGDDEDATHRLHALDLRDLTAVKQARSAARNPEPQGNCPVQYLRQIMGCITRAVAYCHNSNIRHLDLKPSNILLNPGRVYLADFGIAKDVHDRENTRTIGLQGTPKWRAPELHQTKTDWSMKAADIYSLGLVLLNISTAIYYAPLDQFDAVLADVSKDGRAEKLREYLPKLGERALATQEFDDPNAPTFGPKHILRLISRMVSTEPSSRPVIFQVDNDLVELGGIEQIYHSSCCKRSSRFVTNRMNAKLRSVADERIRLRAEREEMAKQLRVLEAKDETYESRILHERKTHAENISKLQENIARLQAQLEKERMERKKSEDAMHQNRRQTRPGIPRPASHHQPAHAIPNPGGLEMRTRPRTHPLPTTAAQHQPPPVHVQQSISPASVGHGPRLSYSQTAAAAVSPKAAAAVRPKATAIAAPPRRDSLIPSPNPSPGPMRTSTPDLAGYTLRSRPSGSRLPLAVNPTTPIRANTPNLNRDPSSTDSTTYSMSDSVFSRMSASKLSVAATSVAGTPAHSPAVLDMRRPASPTTAVPVDPHHKGDASPRPSIPEDAHGLGLGLTDRERRESVTSGTGQDESIRDTISIASSAAIAPGTMSPALSGSVMSSPRTGHASLASGGGAGGGRMPPLPTAKSWADVARRERRERRG